MISRLSSRVTSCVRTARRDTKIWRANYELTLIRIVEIVYFILFVSHLVTLDSSEYGKFVEGFQFYRERDSEKRKVVLIREFVTPHSIDLWSCFTILKRNWIVNWICYTIYSWTFNVRILTWIFKMNIRGKGGCTIGVDEDSWQSRWSNMINDRYREKYPRNFILSQSIWRGKVNLSLEFLFVVQLSERYSFRSLINASWNNQVANATRHSVSGNPVFPH